MAKPTPVIPPQSDEAIIEELYNDVKNLIRLPVKTSYDPSPFFESTITYQILHSNDGIYCNFPYKRKDVVYYEEGQLISVAVEKWNNVNLPKANQITQSFENELNRLWKLKKEDMLHYPSLYNKCGDVSFTIEDSSAGINFVRLQALKANRCIPKIRIPFEIKEDRILPAMLLKGRPGNPIVSLDKTAQELAESKDVDVVISCSGLKTIADNYSSSKGSDWIVPFSIREVIRSDGMKKLVLFVDKATVRPNMSKIELKNWHGKKAVNSFMSLNKLLFRELPEDFATVERPVHKPVVNQETTQENTAMEVEPEIHKMPITHAGAQSNIVRRHYSYELWKLEELAEKKILMKNVKRNLKILVRNKKPSIMHSNPGNFCVSSKLEYQSEFGGELMTLSQLTREWMSLLLNPRGNLIRVRADANNLAYKRHEGSNITNIEDNIKILYNVQVKNQLYIVYNTLNYLTTLPKGQYLLCHDRNGGAFASVLKAVESKCKGSFNLNQYLDKLTMVDSCTIWPIIDRNLITQKLRPKQLCQHNRQQLKKKRCKQNKRKRERIASDLSKDAKRTT